MTQANQGPVVEVKPQPNVYTALLIVAILAMLAAMYFGLDKLMAAPAEGGYGMTFGEILQGGGGK